MVEWLVEPSGLAETWGQGGGEDAMNAMGEDERRLNDADNEQYARTGTMNKKTRG